MNDDDAQDQAASSPAEVIKRHIRGIRMALSAIDLMCPGSEVITSRMRGTTETLTIDLADLADFTRTRT